MDRFTREGRRRGEEGEGEGEGDNSKKSKSKKYYSSGRVKVEKKEMLLSRIGSTEPYM